MNEIDVEYAITIFSGYLQTLGSPGSGMVGIEHAAASAACNRPDVRVRLFPWNTDEGDIAESIWRYRPRENGKDPKQKHVVVGYSYGGDRAVKFCNSLQRRGGGIVQELWLCDAVRRFDCLPGVAAAGGWGKLMIPTIVQSCSYFVQRNPRWGFRKQLFQPRGHKVVARDPEVTKIKGPFVKDAVHSYMDNDNEFRSGVLAAVDRLLDSAAEARP